MTALGDHATAELDLLGVANPIRSATIQIVGTLADLTPADRDTVNRYVTTLLRFLPLKALTSDPAQWVDRSAMLGERPYWQSKRNPDAWSRDGGKTYYLQSEQGQTHISDPP